MPRLDSVTASVTGHGPAVEVLLDAPEPTVRLVGDLDMLAGPALADALASAFDGADVGGVVVDLSGVAFLDSFGLHALLTARTSEQVSRFVNPSDVVARVVSVTGLDEVFFPAESVSTGP